jgi:hypothetical protein
VKVYFFQCKIKGIFVIMEKLQAPFCKSFGLGSNSKFVKDFLARVLAIIALAALLQVSPEFVVFCYQEVIFLY